MKRLILFAAVLLLLLAVPLGSASAKKGPKEPKVTICHVDHASDIVHGQSKPYRQWAFGTIKQIPAASLDAHIAHGDGYFLNGTGPEGGGAYFTADGNPAGWTNLHEVAAFHDLRIHKKANCAAEQASVPTDHPPGEGNP